MILVLYGQIFQSNNSASDYYGHLIGCLPFTGPNNRDVQSSFLTYQVPRMEMKTPSVRVYYDSASKFYQIRNWYVEGGEKIVLFFVFFFFCINWPWMSVCWFEIIVIIIFFFLNSGVFIYFYIYSINRFLSWTQIL